MRKVKAGPPSLSHLHTVLQAQAQVQQRKSTSVASKEEVANPTIERLPRTDVSRISPHPNPPRCLAALTFPPISSGRSSVRFPPRQLEGVEDEDGVRWMGWNEDLEV